MVRRLRPLLPALVLLTLLSVPGRAAALPLQSLPEVVDPPFFFERPLPLSGPVSPEWFSDAVFLGDSRSRALLDAHLFQPGLDLAQIGLNVRSARTGNDFFVNGRRLSLSDALAGGGYTKIYLSLGFSEASWLNEEEFYREYAGLIDDLRRVLPQARIYVQTILPVTVSRAVSRSPDNQLLARRNDLLFRLARDKQVYLVDTASAFSTGGGALIPDQSTDGFHLTESGNALWCFYLRTHAAGI